MFFQSNIGYTVNHTNVQPIDSEFGPIDSENGVLSVCVGCKNMLLEKVCGIASVNVSPLFPLMSLPHRHTHS